MATVIVGAYMVRYPLGAMMSWVYQYLTGIKQLGHEVYFVEQFVYPDSCFNPAENTMTNDCSYGTTMVNNLLKQADLEHNWCFVDYYGNYHGMSKQKVLSVFEKADLYIDMGTGNGWEEERPDSNMTVLIDGEPGFTHIRRSENIPYPEYHHYYTVGYNIGKPGNPVPTGGIHWKHIHDPVNTSLFNVSLPSPDAPITTLMNWQSHQPVEYKGQSYGQKDIEFIKFIDLPARTQTNFELAVSGKNTPVPLLNSHGWNLVRAHDTTMSYEVFLNYMSRSKAEFSVCKNVFVALRTGLFSDRSAAFLASGRPVVMQDTGFSESLPCGKGLFAVNNIDEAAEAVEEINRNWKTQSKAAREVAVECLDTRIILENFFRDLGITNKVLHYYNV